MRNGRVLMVIPFLLKCGFYPRPLALETAPGIPRLRKAAGTHPGLSCASDLRQQYAVIRDASMTTTPATGLERLVLRAIRALPSPERRAR